jgi:hypothetical protein
MSPARWFLVPFILLAEVMGFIFAVVPALMFLNYAVKRIARSKQH